jgi:hypothetical protein
MSLGLERGEATLKICRKWIEMFPFQISKVLRRKNTSKEFSFFALFLLFLLSFEL